MSMKAHTGDYSVAYINEMRATDDVTGEVSADLITAPKYERKAHTLSSLKSIAKREEQNMRKMKKEVRMKQALVARIEKAQAAYNDARGVNAALDQIIQNKFGVRYVPTR